MVVKRSFTGVSDSTRFVGLFPLHKHKICDSFYGHSNKTHKHLSALVLVSHISWMANAATTKWPVVTLPIKRSDIQIRLNTFAAVVELSADNFSWREGILIEKHLYTEPLASRPTLTQNRFFKTLS